MVPINQSLCLTSAGSLTRGSSLSTLSTSPRSQARSISFASITLHIITIRYIWIVLCCCKFTQDIPDVGLGHFRIPANLRIPANFRIPANEWRKYMYCKFQVGCPKKNAMIEFQIDPSHLAQLSSLLNAISQFIFQYCIMWTTMQPEIYGTI